MHYNRIMPTWINKDVPSRSLLLTIITIKHLTILIANGKSKVNKAFNSDVEVIPIVRLVRFLTPNFSSKELVYTWQDPTIVRPIVGFMYNCTLIFNVGIEKLGLEIEYSLVVAVCGMHK